MTDQSLLGSRVGRSGRVRSLYPWVDARCPEAIRGSVKWRRLSIVPSSFPLSASPYTSAASRTPPHAQAPYQVNGEYRLIIALSLGLSYVRASAHIVAARREGVSRTVRPVSTIRLCDSRSDALVSSLLGQYGIHIAARCSAIGCPRTRLSQRWRPYSAQENAPTAFSRRNMLVFAYWLASCQKQHVTPAGLAQNKRTYSLYCTLAGNTALNTV